MAEQAKVLIAGNWKMNGMGGHLPELQAIAGGLAEMTGDFDALICTPATLIERAARQSVGTRLMIGAQDCHAEASGAHTGDISCAMIKDAGACAVIVGHSERRTDHRESDTDVLQKAMAAHDEGLIAIICVGETRQEREDGQAMNVVDRQLKGSIPEGATAANTVIAYEPVWAIGTGLTPSTHDIAAMHGHIRATLKARFGAKANAMRILYGGSMKPSNAAEILGISDVNGGLIGGASLKSGDFLSICAAVDD